LRESFEELINFAVNKLEQVCELVKASWTPVIKRHFIIRVLCLLLAAKEQYDEAIKLIKRCIKKHPDFEAAKCKLQDIKARAHDKAAS
jgi:hypothetical protein